MATGILNLDNQANHLGKLKVFAGVKDLPSRVKCAILPWHTLHAALNPILSTVEGAESSISTEGEADPVPGTAIGEE
jgi:nitrogen fixation NifU-like protein